MVGRLVEDQEVDRLEQQLDHRQARAFTPRKNLHFLGRIFAAEHERAQQILDLVAHVAYRHIVDRLEHRQVLIQQ